MAVKIPYEVFPNCPEATDISRTSIVGELIIYFAGVFSFFVGIYSVPVFPFVEINSPFLEKLLTALWIIGTVSATIALEKIHHNRRDRKIEAALRKEADKRAAVIRIVKENSFQNGTVSVCPRCGRVIRSHSRSPICQQCRITTVFTGIGVDAWQALPYSLRNEIIEKAKKQAITGGEIENAPKSSKSRITTGKSKNTYVPKH